MIPEVIETNIDLYKGILPKRNSDSNKGDYGHAYIVGGSEDFGGAPLLSYYAICALCLGAGYATLFVPENLYKIYVGRMPQLIVKKLPENAGKFCFDHEKYSKITANPGSIAFGMGVGVSRDIYQIISYFLKNYGGNLILDADALNAISKYGIDVLNEHKCRLIITPHIGEFSRLINKSVEEIKSDPISYAFEFSKRYKCVVVLKDSKTIISDENNIYLNKTGNASLAKAGSGDILSGILAGLFAQKQLIKEPAKLASFASFLLGKCAEEITKRKSEYSVLASDIIDELGVELKKIISF